MQEQQVVNGFCENYCRFAQLVVPHEDVLKLFYIDRDVAAQIFRDIISDVVDVRRSLSVNDKVKLDVVSDEKFTDDVDNCFCNWILQGKF
jgi:hypothetical protein